MEDAISPGLLEPFGGRIDSLSGRCKGTRGQRLDVLGVADFSTSVDDFLSSLAKFLSELSKLKNFSFDERISEPVYGAVDELLVWLPVLEQALSKWGEQ